MRTRFLVTGGEQYPDAVNRPEGARFKQAKLLSVDIKSGAVDVLLRHESAYPTGAPNSIYVSGSLSGGRIYLATSTQIFVYSYPDLKLLKSKSLPFFQNLHHIVAVKEGIAVAVTGLDLVVVLNEQTLEPTNFYHALGKDPWHKYSMDKDYREIISLKPHESHPNYIFQFKDDLWITRFNQKDIICLSDMSKRISIDVERLHDGFVQGNYVYLTSVNGCVIKADLKTLTIKKVLDLNKIENAKTPLGWCRGLFVEGDLVYVGFTRIRETKVKENLKWAASIVKGAKEWPTRIAVYDFEKEEKLAAYELPVDSISAIYSVIGI